MTWQTSLRFYFGSNKTKKILREWRVYIDAYKTDGKSKSKKRREGKYLKCMIDCGFCVSQTCTGRIKFFYLVFWVLFLFAAEYDTIGKIETQSPYRRCQPITLEDWNPIFCPLHVSWFDFLPKQLRKNKVGQIFGFFSCVVCISKQPGVFMIIQIQFDAAIDTKSGLTP